MKWKTRLDLSTTDPFNSLEKVKKITGVLNAYVVDAESILVLFDNRKTSKEQIIDSIK